MDVAKIQPINEKDNDKTFNRLRQLQDLLKKESALKELCKKYYSNNKFKNFSPQFKRRIKKPNRRKL